MNCRCCNKALVNPKPNQIYCSQSECQRQRKAKNRRAHQCRPDAAQTPARALSSQKNQDSFEARLKVALEELRDLRRRYIILHGAYMAARETGDM